jgi:hypothetical protein
MTEAVSRLFEKALSGDASQHLEFVKGIPMLLSLFPPDWVATRLLPFLALWLPLSDDALISATLSTLSLVLASAGAIEPLAPVVELVLSSDNANASRVVVELVTSSLFDDTLSAFVNRLADSLYDPVRAFVPQVVYLLPSDEAKMQIFGKALVDRSFKVRSACARSIAELSDSLARHVASALQSDPHPRVRSAPPASPRAARSSWASSTRTRALRTTQTGPSGRLSRQDSRSRRPRIARWSCSAA